MNLDTIIACLAALGYIYFIIATRKTKTFDDYAVADRKTGFFLLFASASANYIGPGFTLGLVNQGFSGGYLYIIIAGFYGIGKIIEGRLISPRLREKFKDCYSIGEIIGGKQTHNHKAVHLLTGLLAFGLVVGFCVIMSKAGGEILNAFIGIPKEIGTIVITLLVMSYSIFGGIKSSMLTDTVQFTLFMVLLPALALIVFANSAITTEQFTTKAVTLTQESFNNTSGLFIFSTALTWFLGEMLVPPTIGAILAGKDKNTASKALTYSGTLMILWLVLMLTLGIMSKIVLQETTGNDQVLLFLGKSFFPQGLFGLFTVAMIGVVMSSQDSLMNSASVVFTRDVIGVFKVLNEKNSLIYSRITGFIVGVFSIIFAMYIPSIITGLLFFYTIWVPTILVVCIFSVYLKQHFWQAAITSMLSGMVTAITWDYFPFKETIPTIMAGLFVSIISYLGVHYSLKKSIK